MNADRNLLFGFVCVQNGFVRQAAMIDAMSAWAQAKNQPLGDILKERGVLSATRHDLVAALVAEQLAQHGGDAAASLAALESATPAKDALRSVAEAGVRTSLGATVDDPSAPTSGPAAAIRREGGRFRIVKPHAKGGLGEVFLAEDNEIKRNVALKEIRADRTADKASIARFVKEAEITGQLEHPGVVPIYGAGTYADGRPFYAMRFIQGRELKEAIADFHATAGNPPREREFLSAPFRDLLSRFIDVCNAVAYAHSRGVLHRDLKPGNIMLGKYGETLVVDWGLAKVVGPDESSASEIPVQSSSIDGGQTLPGNVLGTPAYMSPEQAAGKIGELGPATDIYALGAILHAILTGQPPIAPGPLGDVLRRVKEGLLLPAGNAPKPLAAVARRAMSLSPDARYKSALDVAAEIEHWLADEPVQTYQDPPLARAARWTRKHPATTAVAASVALMLLLGLGAGLSMASRFNDRLKRQNEELIASRKEVREALDAATDGAIQDLLAGKQQLTDKERRYLEEAAKRYEAFAARAGGADDALAFQAAGLFRVGFIRYRLSLIAEAEASWVKALELREKLAAANPSVAQIQDDLAATLINLGNLYRDTGRAKEAEAAFSRALALQEKLAAANPSVAAYQSAVATSHNNLGSLLRVIGRTKEAEAAYSKALALREKLAAAHPTVDRHQNDLASSHNSLGVLFRATGRTKEAEAAFSMSLAIREKLTAANPPAAQHQYDLAASYNNLGSLRYDTGRWKEAEAPYSKALALREKLAAANPSVAQYQNELAASQTNLGNLYSATGRSVNAEAAYAKALALREKLAAANPSVAAYQVNLASTHNSLGVMFRAAGRMNEAEAAHLAALALQEKLAADNPSLATLRSDLATTHNNLGSLYCDMGRTKDAEAAFSKALALQGKLAEEHPAIPDRLIDLAITHVNLGLLVRPDRPADALARYRRAIALLNEAQAKDPGSATPRRFLGSAHWGEAEALDDLARHAEAVVAWRQAIALSPPPERQQLQVNLALALARAGRAAEAVKAAESLGAKPEDQWNAARVLSVASAANGVSAADRESWRHEAVELLRLAKQPATRLAKEKDLDALRPRKDFERLTQPAPPPSNKAKR